jgi:hypothetical protein
MLKQSFDAYHVLPDSSNYFQVQDYRLHFTLIVIHIFTCLNLSTPGTKREK